MGDALPYLSMEKSLLKYCESISQTKRWKTREVRVGDVGVGGDNPIRIQSMTTSPTSDVDATVDQIMHLVDVGCEIARVTVQGKAEARACEKIKSLLVQKGYSIPIVADIHFYPPAAMEVVEFVDKVRVNPGNFADRRATFRTIEYDDKSYHSELQRIEELFAPLVEKCARLGRSMRIGTNHGSLSDRIMNRYGDSPAGMVESALEFAQICRKYGYHDFIFSMKASNPKVMVQAYRLLVAEMMKLGWNYPLHLGVTEAGCGQEGRVKSAAGTGTLLLDGLGDTVRVSLTEDPWQEIEPCKHLVQIANQAQGKGISPFIESHRDITKIEKRVTEIFPPLHRDGSVILYKKHLDELDLNQETDAIYFPSISEGELAPLLEKNIKVITETPGMPGTLHIQNLDEIEEQTDPAMVMIQDGDPTLWRKLLSLSVQAIFFKMSESFVHQGRYFFEWMRSNGLKVPVILVGAYQGSEEEITLKASVELSSLLLDGYGEGVMLITPLDDETNQSLAFNLLQACRMRAVKTEYIACPGCGRTLFDLQEVTQRIQKRTSHLPGVKIAIMGCIVNGPGEMADADFGYVGSKKGKVDLYVGKTCVEKGIDFVDADERLIDLIKAHGRWIPVQKEELVLTP